MAVKLHLHAEIKNAKNKRILVIHANGEYHKFVDRVSKKAREIGGSGGTIVVTADEWDKGVSQTIKL